jgi:hypothetical protein
MAYTKKSRTKKQIQKAFLEDIEKTGVISTACKSSGLARRTFYNYTNSKHVTYDEAFYNEYIISQAIGTDLLEEEAHRRAYTGVKKPVYHGGKLVGYMKEYSDTLLIFLLKGKKPEIYKDRHELTGKNGEPLPASIFNINIIESGPKPVNSERDIDF